jgi:hypothetical protein
VLAWTMTAAQVDSSRQRHQASENSGQTGAAVIAGIIAVNQVRLTRNQRRCRDRAADLGV